MNADDEKKLNQIAYSFYYGKATADRVDAAVRAAYALGRRAGMTEAAGIVRGGRFLNNESGAYRLAQECAAAIEKVRDA